MNRKKIWEKQGKYKSINTGKPMILVMDKETGATVLEPLYKGRKGEYTNMIQNIKTQDQARQYAIDWQIKQSEQESSFNELLQAQAEFEALAKKFDLVEEFKENGII